MRPHDPARIAKLLNPQSVAVIGASDDPSRIGGRPISYMLGQGYQGRIFPVNPNRTTVQGLTAYPSVAALPETPDIAIVIVPASAALDSVTALAERGCAAAILFTAGFAETGPEGAREQQKLVDAAHKHGMRLIGPNSLGLINPCNHFYGTFATGCELAFPKAGGVAIISQSGAYGAHLMAVSTANDIGLSAVILTGNEADLTVGDMLQMVVEDPATKVIMLYSEGIKESAGLLAGLDAARRARKPVLMMKVGRSAIGSAAAQSHTASIAGDDRVTDAVLKEFGVVRVQTTEQMLDIARLATRGIYPAHNTLGVITVSGGAGVIISDAADAVGLPMPEMPLDAQERLLKLLPFAAPRNPVDVTAQFLNEMSLISTFTDALIAEGKYTSILGFFTYTGGVASVAPRLREQLKITRSKHPDCIFALSLMASREQIREYENDGFAVFEDPSRAVVAIEAMGQFGRAFAKAPALPAPKLAPISLPTHNPSEAQAKQLLAQAGIASAPEEVCTTIEAAVTAAQKIGFPVVMKIVSPDILHKSEIGGVLLDIHHEADVREGFALLMQRGKTAAPQARLEGVLVAKQLKGGVECILGIHQDPVFGPVAMFGLGGIFVEILQDVVLHRCPFGPDVAEEMIRSIKGSPLLLGARGRPVADIKALSEMLSQLSAFAVAAGPRLQSIDLNPVLAMPQGQGAYAVDAVIEVTQG
ncbi:acetate--CoA ligase family protein [Zwartia panacis]|uniref:acetate--CoA ligase family protein n=1 Tax=Zwartia panacis TaxID=2683345 RepID=UPI0025B62A61|nr:acetate--CoA ligase family protein [Zwartia panacis]MDN4018083.1 acetate--CoA ligase family protein [Zwartia panacis]